MVGKSGRKLHGINGNLVPGLPCQTLRKQPNLLLPDLPRVSPEDIRRRDVRNTQHPNRLTLIKYCPFRHDSSFSYLRLAPYLSVVKTSYHKNSPLSRGYCSHVLLVLLQMHTALPLLYPIFQARVFPKIHIPRHIPRQLNQFMILQSR